MNEQTVKVPVMLYDRDCGFCLRWIEKWRRITGRSVCYEPFQDALARFPQVTRAQCEQAVQLVLPDGAVFSGAHAAFKAFALAGRYRALLKWYEAAPFFRGAAEGVYRVVAGHRSLLSRFFHSPQCRK